MFSRSIRAAYRQSMPVMQMRAMLLSRLISRLSFSLEEQKYEFSRLAAEKERKRLLQAQDSFLSLRQISFKILSIYEEIYPFSLLNDPGMGRIAGTAAGRHL